MSSFLKSYVILFVCILCVFSPHVASAHEVYVLTPAQIQQAIHTPSISPVAVIEQNARQFTFWAFLGGFILLAIFLISIFRPLERLCAPFLTKLKPFAPIIGRITVGLSFIAAAYYRASYGPELPLAQTFGHFTPFVVGLLYIIGIMIILGLWVRVAAFAALCMFAIAVYVHGYYMLTYVNYLGEIIILLLLGAGGFALQKSVRFAGRKQIEKIGFFILRVLFGTALIFASAYAKLIYSNLAFDTVTKYHL